MLADAVILDAPGRISRRPATLRDPAPGEVVVAVRHSGISTGTEKLLWSGRMPAFQCRWLVSFCDLRLFAR